MENNKWSYQEFLAFLMIYGAEMNYPLSDEELAFIKERTGIADVLSIKNVVDSTSDADAIELIDSYRIHYLDTPEKEEKVRQDLEDLLKTGGLHSQLEQAGIHILERFI